MARFGRDVRPIVFAHRGAAAELPENTLPSFQRALELGADALETDLHMTLDGVIVVGHDPTGWRTCGVAAPIKTSLLREVKQWDAGFGFIEGAGPQEGVEEGRGDAAARNRPTLPPPSGDPTVPIAGRPFAGRGFTIPTLEEMLAAFPGVLINVDAKQQDPPLVPTLLALLERMGAEERVNIASFDRRAVREVRRRGYKGHTGLAPAEIAGMISLPELALRAMRRSGELGDAAQVPVKQPMASKWFVEKCQRLDITVDFWTVNEAAKAVELLSLGVDGIMTDDPRVVVPAVKAARTAP